MDVRKDEVCADQGVLKCSLPTNLIRRLWEAEVHATSSWSSCRVPLFLQWFCCHERPQSQICPVNRCYCGILCRKTLKFHLIVMFAFIIVFMTQEQSLRAMTVPPYWGCDLWSMLFYIPDKIHVYFVDKNKQTKNTSVPWEIIMF